MQLNATEGSADSSKSEESIPSWAKPGSDEPPPWAQGEGKSSTAQQSFEVPFFVYLLASAVTAIAAVGSIFEYVNQRPVFGVLNSDSIFYAPLLGFFAFTGIPTSAFLWFKSVQAANKEAEEQDKRDGFL
ncbi:Dimethylaniline monooxygenase [N-oxide-forming] 1 [Gossypium australe]|uniref:Dimethylaniline monooxygenase [N-oxide-forming] 1 n=1 Tax=Gossypium australe TaxID=47621 RepID=A0A5B6UBJ5_9ROSI|nr:Dimethylaniline monooxygenase [N-oxide-forming] 1 [Gossypium australe]